MVQGHICDIFPLVVYAEKKISLICHLHYLALVASLYKHSLLRLPDVKSLNPPIRFFLELIHFLPIGILNLLNLATISALWKQKKYPCMSFYLKVQKDILENTNFILIALKVNVPPSLQITVLSHTPEGIYAHRSDEPETLLQYIMCHSPLRKLYSTVSKSTTIPGRKIRLLMIACQINTV